MKTCFIYRVLFICIFCMLGHTIFAQTRSISGLVSDNIGNPLIGVTISVKGTSLGVVTDVNGAYTMHNITVGQTLVFSYIGYRTEEVLIRNQEVINIIMSENSVLMEEVVVVGYGTQKKVSVTGSVSNVPVKSLQMNSTPSLNNAISGKIPGIITRQTSGEPGYDAANIYIRGIGTLGNRNPLVLVDGIERDMSNLNVNEIESFSVLKDASATAVYGVRGANGVILINTKRGTVGKPTVVLRSEVAMLVPQRLPDYINGYEYAQLMNEAYIHSGKGVRWSIEELNKFKDGSEPYLYPNVDWLDVILKKRTMQTVHNLSVTGGAERVRYYVNVGFTMEDGIYKQDNLNAYKTNANLQRYSFRSNVDIDITRTVNMNLGIGGIVDERHYPGNSGIGIFDAAKRTSPISFPVRNPDGSPGGVNTYIGSNPWGMATQSGYSADRHHTIQANFGLKWDLGNLITKGLSVNGKFAYDLYYYTKAERAKQFEVKQYLGKDETTGEDMYVVFREEGVLGYNKYSTGNRAYYMEGAINYDRTFNKVHSVSAMLLANRREYVDYGAGTSILNLPYRRQGVAGRATYDYANRYLIEFNFGYNGSENFPNGQKYGFFPSASVGWVLSNENFWHVDAISHLKLRGSFGKVGNDQIGGDRFLYLTTINKNAAGYGFGESERWYSGMAEDKMGIANITWEVSNKANIGVDLKLFNDKLSLVADAFWEKRNGIFLKRQQIPGFLGYASNSIPYGNIGVVKNRGIDGSIEFKNTTPEGFYYSVLANITFARNKVVENDEPTPKFDYLSTIGRPIGQNYGLIAEGIFQNEEEIKASPKHTFSPVHVGDIKYKDVNGDKVIDDYDRVPIGHPRIPEMTFGFGGTVAYKGFDLSLFFTGATRTSLFMEGWTIWPFVEGAGVFNIQREYYDNRWTEDNRNGKYPAPYENANPNNQRRSTLWMKDGTYLRLKTAELGYNLPKKCLIKLRIKDMRVFINGMNLLTWDKIDIMDPESDDGSGGYPLNMQVNGGVQITF